MNIDILFQDKDLIAVTKPSGLLVHPYYKETNERESLMRQVRDQIGQYVYPLHRLDRPVSGVVLFALNKEFAREMQKNWHQDNMKKIYLAICRRKLELPGVHDFSLSNSKGVKQDALTKFWPIKIFQDSTYLKIQILTGRTHQIRRHFSRRCFNIVGDTAYGKGDINRRYRADYDLKRIFLHAYQTEFIHPLTQEEICLKSPLPDELRQILEAQGVKKSELYPE